MQKALTVAWLLGMAACSREHAPPAQPSPKPVAAERVSAPVGMNTLAGTLRDEAAHRPDGATRAEDVFAALATAGVTVSSPRQYLGLTARAEYCAGGTTADGLAVAVCEYASPEAALAGRAFVEDRYAVMNSYRAIHVRGATTLTLTTAPERPLADTARRATTAFESL
jgi:hypothetical protein